MSTNTSSESELGEGPGMIPERRIRNRSLTALDEVRAIYASAVDSTDEPDPRRVGRPGSYVNRKY
jgi:hypothetical protein